MKPLSPKTLERKYAELGLSKAKIDLLRNYFLCCANLYGMLEVREAWDVFKHYEGNKIRKKNFIAFSGIVQREPALPFSVLDLNEVYTAEPAGMSDRRLIVNNDLIGMGYGKYEQIYRLSDLAVDKPIWLPEAKDELFEYKVDRFYLSEEGKKMTAFLSNLKSTGIFKTYGNDSSGEIQDIDGNPVKGKRLSDFIIYTQIEQVDINYYKSEYKKEALRHLYKKTSLNKIQDYIRTNIQIGSRLHRSFADDLSHTISFMDEFFGATMTQEQLEQFIELYTNLNNHSHLWQNCGWKPDDLFRATNSGMPKSVSIGASLQKLFDSGELNRDEFEEGLRQIGIELIQ